MDPKQGILMNARLDALGIAALLAVGGCSLPPHLEVDYDGVDSRWVQMGGDVDLDACPGIGAIKAGRTAEVRDAPLIEAQEVDRLRAGTPVWICEVPDDEPGWSGVVYRRPSDPQECPGVATPSATRIAAPSTCGAGWVKSDDIDVMAG
jgi:hypothetical protein